MTLNQPEFNLAASLGHSEFVRVVSILVKFLRFKGFSFNFMLKRFLLKINGSLSC